jgi:4-hydroxy-4-methyl-2-oxoglutarate aldolase
MNELEMPSTAALSDACLRLGIAKRVLPAAKLAGVMSGAKAFGPAAPVKHFGSVDVVLKAIDHYEQGSFLVIDNEAREDEACVGDLLALEAKQAGIAGMVIWGYHRDTAQLREIGLPVFSLGAHPDGPARPVASSALPESVRIADFEVTQADWVVADDDGVIFLTKDAILAAREVAASIAAVEVRQANQMKAGESLRSQTQFDLYLAKSAANDEYTFRKHLRIVGGEIEE